MKSERRRISFYGNFGAGNLGNESTLQAVIEQILRRWPDAELSCFCSNPEDVRTRHKIAAFPSEAVSKTDRQGSHSREPWARILRIVFHRIPRELIHWIKSLRAVSRTDMLIVAGTGIVADYMCGPLGWPYDIFKLSTLATVCRVKFVFLSVGVGPIHHPLSRWFLKRSLARAHYRSYRDEASKQYLESIGFDTARDAVYPDVVFALAPDSFDLYVRTGQRPIVGLGLKDYGSTERLEPEAFGEYLDKMAAFASWLQGRGYGVRLLIGDFQYDTWVVTEFLNILKSRNIPTDPPLLIAEPALTVEQLLRQLGETEAVISARYHNLVLALIQNKPVIALSDHPKLDSLVTDFGLGRYLVSLRNLSTDVLVGKFQQLVDDTKRLKPYINGVLTKYRQSLDAQYAALLAESKPATRLPMLRRSPVDLFLGLNARLWRRIPPKLRNTRAIRLYGTLLHRLVCHRADRMQFTHTYFYRNRPELELMRRLIAQKPESSTLDIAVLGCSIGAEVYSIVSTIRRARPDLRVHMRAVDRSAEVLKVASEAVYTSQVCDLVRSPIFERMTDVEFEELFEGDRREARVRPSLREGISWHLGDASDPELVRILGPCDIVVASNFLCHMEPLDAAECLRNIARIAKPGGSLFVSGVDLDVRERVARDLQWRPIPELIAEVHDGDPSVRRDWPFAWWGLEPLDATRHDWQMRYAAVFQLNRSA